MKNLGRAVLLLGMYVGLYVGLPVLVVWGWILNILDLLHMHEVLSGLGILRVVGIFLPPLGAVLGFFS
jgi:hypothetical protein